MDGQLSRTHLLPLDLELEDRVVWFTRLRWLAALTVLLGGSGFRLLLGWPLSYGVEAVGLVLLGYNLLLGLVILQLPRPTTPRRTWIRLARTQITLDLLLLAVLVHYTGGPFSPLLPFTIIHVMLAAILLRRREVLIWGGLAILLTAMLFALDRSGLFLPQTLGGRLPDPTRVELSTLLVVFSGTTLLLVCVAWLASALGGGVRLREKQLLQVQGELQEAIRGLEELSRAKANYTKMVTHELRSPAGALFSLLEVVRQGLAGELPPKAQELLDRAARRAALLVELVNQLLDLARDRAVLDPARTAPVSLTALLHGVEEAYGPPAALKGVTLQVPPPAADLVVRGDAAELEKLFSNLVSNAVKYTLPGGQVTVSCQAEGEQVVCEVTDSGIGIPLAEQDRLFSEFFRASNARQQQEEHGTGLGLAIVKRIVEAHQGRVSFRSQPGEGTSFRVELPAARGRTGA
ncbi:MAG: HAMP domain-containing sensor histidine kinase [Myxococcota bacterium]|jgi:signal transduction histidine kinase|nr:HAMP domain-containing sensor histidine kinase [Myxococcota bacterium]